MEINRVMILFSGCFLIVWSTFKWKIPNVIWNAKLTKVCSVALGLYNIILAICYEKDLNIALFIVDFILYINTNTNTKASHCIYSGWLRFTS